MQARELSAVARQARVRVLSEGGIKILKLKKNTRRIIPIFVAEKLK